MNGLQKFYLLRTLHILSAGLILPFLLWFWVWDMVGSLFGLYVTEPIANAFFEQECKVLTDWAGTDQNKIKKATDLLY